MFFFLYFCAKPTLFFKIFYRQFYLKEKKELVNERDEKLTVTKMHVHSEHCISHVIFSMKNGATYKVIDKKYKLFPWKK